MPGNGIAIRLTIFVHSNKTLNNDSAPQGRTQQMIFAEAPAKITC